ncbi:MAG TPA: di-heme oxidoredictase family protein, partial [Planctomycetota bacterium]|nr:di-heme oxidoredictase family protein [Planctomycetota bacterium]
MRPIGWKLLGLGTLGGLVVALAGCSSASGSSGGASSGASGADNVSADTPAPPDPVPLGKPLPGLEAADVTAFADGLDDFEEVEAPPRLGPLFNARSCAECHGLGAPGGAGAISVVRFGHVDRETGAFDALDAKGGSLLQLFSVDPSLQEVLPREANVVGHRNTTPIFGDGLVEAIPDDQIRAVAAQQAASAPDMAGKVALVTEDSDHAQHVGRLGWKAQH